MTVGTKAAAPAGNVAAAKPKPRLKQTRKARAARRRSRRVAAADNDLTALEWASLIEAWGGCCAYCGALTTSPQKDCVQPIAHGGRYTFTNVVPACRSCNASKCDQEVTIWLRRKRLDEKEFLRRLVEIRLSFAMTAVA